MSEILRLVSGRKTYSIGVALIAYLVVQFLNKEPADMTIITGLLSGQAMALRAGVKKAESASAANGAKP